MRVAFSLGCLAGSMLPCGAAIAQCELQKLHADDMACDADFGFALALSGTSLLVGAPLEDGQVSNSGAGYVFDVTRTGAWAQEQKLTVSGASIGMGLGSAVSIDDGRALLGAPNADNSRGAAYVFTKGGAGWLETAKLVASDGESGDFLAGSGVSIHGDVLVLGAEHAGQSWTNEGLAYVFEWEGSSWVETAKLRASDAAYGDNLGVSVAVSGTTIVVGAIGEDGSTFDEGAAYVFEKQATLWLQVAKLTASEGAPDDRFGAAVTIDGDIIAVSAFLDDDRASDGGAVYVFERKSDRTWGPHENAQLLASDGQPSDKLGGLSVAVSGSRLLAPASADDDVASTAGAAYLFERRPSGWAQVAKLTASDGSISDIFGRSVALQGELALVGATGDDDSDSSDIGCNSGAAYLFQMPFAVETCCWGDVCPCGNDDPARGCDNSTGFGAELGASGSTSYTADDLVLHVTHLPLNQFSIMYMGVGQTSAPFGDGLRCVVTGGVGLFRYLPPQNSGPSGTITLGPGIVSRSRSFPPGGEIDAGESWNFQAWYRDPMGPCGAAFNLSNGIRVTFSP